MTKTRRLSDRIAEEILSMITFEKLFRPGEQLPNENDLAEQLEVSRTTLREALRILVTHGVIEIRRGRGTFVRNDFNPDEVMNLSSLIDPQINLRDLYEMRLIFEPEAAYYATLRASDQEIDRILSYGKLIEEKIKQNEDRTEAEQNFHQAIAKATRNTFMDQLLPVIFQGINQGVKLSKLKQDVLEHTIRDHRLIMEFMQARNADGAKSAMKIHILHAMKQMELME
ncbi:MAG TPA: FadR/GntR family transcriptional regulator [Pseudogracilibacillus sp.]|nr:FadR/GntR family transcriptional regulator [Pseudogracilibacillus sp.]